MMYYEMMQQSLPKASNSEFISAKAGLNTTLFNQICFMSSIKLFEAVSTIEKEDPIYSEEELTKIQSATLKLHEEFNSSVFTDQESLSK